MIPSARMPSGDLPLAGDFDSDGQADDVAVFRTAMASETSFTGTMTTTMMAAATIPAPVPGGKPETALLSAILIVMERWTMWRFSTPPTSPGNSITTTMPPPTDPVLPMELRVFSINVGLRRRWLRG